MLSRLRDVEDKSAVVLAIDSTGLKVHASADWYHHKHRAQGPKWHDKWRKLHIGIDTASGRILMGKLTSARTNDAQEGPGMVLDCHRPVKA
ncbi:MAG: transposase, partial [Pseudomonadota bacterium]